MIGCAGNRRCAIWRMAAAEVVPEAIRPLRMSPSPRTSLDWPDLHPPPTATLFDPSIQRRRDGVPPSAKRAGSDMRRLARESSVRLRRISLPRPRRRKINGHRPAPTMARQVPGRKILSTAAILCATVSPRKSRENEAGCRRVKILSPTANAQADEACGSLAIGRSGA